MKNVVSNFPSESLWVKTKTASFCLVAELNIFLKKPCPRFRKVGGEGGGVVAHPSSKEWRESSKCGFIWRFSLAAKAVIHPASHDKEVKMSNGRNKISTQAPFKVSVIDTLLPWAMVCFIVTLRCCHGMSTYLTQINDSRFASWFLLIAQFRNT